MVKAPIPSCDGEIEESSGIGFTTVSVEVLLNEEAELTEAVTVTELGLGTWDGAVYCAARPPVEAIEPTEELPFCRPFTSQVISGLLTPVTTAVNCCVAPARTVIVVGEVVMVCVAGPVGGTVSFGLVKPAQLAISPMERRASIRVSRVRNLCLRANPKD